MTALHALAIFGAGIAAGGINTLVGSGTLISFPVLLAFGYAPVTANVSNTIGLVPGSVAGAVGYREELQGQGEPGVGLGGGPPRRRARRHQAGPLASVGVFVAGIYGGYFGASQEILLLSILGLAIDDDIQ